MALTVLPSFPEDGRAAGRQEMLHQVSLERCIAHRQQYFRRRTQKIAGKYAGTQTRAAAENHNRPVHFAEFSPDKTASVRTAHQNFIFRRRQRFRLGGKDADSYRYRGIR